MLTCFILTSCSAIIGINFLYGMRHIVFGLYEKDYLVNKDIVNEINRNYKNSGFSKIESEILYKLYMYQPLINDIEVYHNNHRKDLLKVFFSMKPLFQNVVLFHPPFFKLFFKFEYVSFNFNYRLTTEKPRTVTIQTLLYIFGSSLIVLYPYNIGKYISASIHYTLKTLYNSTKVSVTSDKIDDDTLDQYK